MIPFFIPSLQGSEIFLIALVILILFGAKKIPEFMRGLGKGVKSFKDGMKDIEKDYDSTNNTDSTSKDSENRN